MTARGIASVVVLLMVSAGQTGTFPCVELRLSSSRLIWIRFFFSLKKKEEKKTTSLNQRMYSRDFSWCCKVCTAYTCVDCVAYIRKKRIVGVPSPSVFFPLMCVIV